MNKPKNDKFHIARFLLLACFLLFSSVCKAAPKAENLDLSRLGTAKILITNEVGESFDVKNREIHLMKVAKAKSENEMVVFEPVGAFAESGIDLSDLGSAQTAKLIYDYSLSNGNPEVKSFTDEEGKTYFYDLEMGLYLVSVKTGEDGVTFSPFLMLLPQADGDTWNYYVIASPKTEASGYVEYHKKLKVKKIWNDDGRNRPASITVELLKNGSPAEEVSLSDANGWEHAWTNLPAADSWSIREKEVPKGYVVSYREETECIYVYNTASLIQTGQLKWPILVLAGIGFAFICVGIWISRVESNKE